MISSISACILAGGTGSCRPRGCKRAWRSETRPGLRRVSGIWAVVPDKELADAKQRLSSCLSRKERRALAKVMLEDVLDAVSAIRQLAGMLVVTVDPVAGSLAGRYGARITTEAAREGHTGAVAGLARLLPREGQAGMMAMPGDIPRLSSAEIAATLAAHQAALLSPSCRRMTISDRIRSSVRRRMSFRCVSARTASIRIPIGPDRGIDPLIVRQPGIGMDIDNPVDLVAFLRMSPFVPPGRLFSLNNRASLAAFWRRTTIFGRRLFRRHEFPGRRQDDGNQSGGVQRRRPPLIRYRAVERGPLSRRAPKRLDKVLLMASGGNS